MVVDTGGGSQTFEITASRAGRRVEVSTTRGMVEVAELTRSGTPVRTGRFMAARVIALVEHPAGTGPVPAEGPPRRQRRRERADQPTLL